MMRAAVLVVALGSCAFAQKHPAVTAGIATGMIALVPCLPAVDTPATCLLIGAGAGLAIGGITGLVTLFADTTAHELREEPEPPIIRRRSKPQPTEAPPPSSDGQTPTRDLSPASLPSAVPSTPIPIDAGVPTPDAAP